MYIYICIDILVRLHILGFGACDFTRFFNGIDP